jgi:hypothetical protein
MSLLSPSRVVTEQFVRPSDGERRGRIRWSSVVALLPGVVTAGAAGLVHARMRDPGLFLAACAIVTGLMFSMATTFWSKSIEARRDSRYVWDGRALDTFDDNRNQLIWTVGVGIAVSACLALTALFAIPPVPIWLTAIVGGSVIYLLTLTAIALKRFYEAFYLLK